MFSRLALLSLVFGAVLLGQMSISEEEGSRALASPDVVAAVDVVVSPPAPAVLFFALLSPAFGDASPSF